jgi:hypothetical protein
LQEIASNRPMPFVVNEVADLSKRIGFIVSTTLVLSLT